MSVESVKELLEERSDSAEDHARRLAEVNTRADGKENYRQIADLFRNEFDFENDETGRRYIVKGLMEINNKFNLDSLEGKEVIGFRSLNEELSPETNGFKTDINRLQKGLRIYISLANEFEQETRSFSRRFDLYDRLLESSTERNEIYERAVEEVEEDLDRREEQIETGYGHAIFIDDTMDYGEVSEMLLGEEVYPVIETLMDYKKEFGEMLSEEGRNAAGTNP